MDYLHANLKLVRESATVVAKLTLEFLKGTRNDALKDKKALIGVVLIAVGSHLYYWKKLSFWSSRGVKTPRPLPFVGNLHSYWFNSRQDLEIAWPRKYGKVYGFYTGTKPLLVCADVNILKRICIKDFDKFTNRYFVGVRTVYQKHSLAFLKDDHWRGMRGLLSPTFASGKIKIMFKILSNCANELTDSYRNQLRASYNGEVILDVRQSFSSFSMGCATSSFYGISLATQEEGNGELVKGSPNTRDAFARIVQRIFEPSFYRFMISFVLPISFLRFINFTNFPEKPMHELAEKARKIIDHRIRSGKRHDDYLQMLLEAKSDSAVERAESDGYEAHHTLLGDNDASNSRATDNMVAKPPKMKLTDIEVDSQAMMLMMVATETTSTLMTHTVYLLAHYPEIQAKLYGELMKLKHLDRRDAFDYEELTSCIYLDCVLSETLRLMTPIIALDREASEDYHVPEYNLLIPKGTVINMAFYAIHHDPDYWPEPDKFDPERFKPENKDKIVPGSYCPFGVGPRFCIGFRFSLTEAKIALAKLLTEFQFKRAPGTKFPPEPKRPAFILNQNKNMIVRMCNR